MKKITLLFLLGLMCCLGTLHAQKVTSFMDADLSTLANNHSEAPLNRQSEIVAVHTSLVTSTFTSRAAFQAACPGLPLEDFTGGPGAGVIFSCTEISNAGSVCYPPGEIITGFVATSSSGNIAAVGTGAAGNTSDAVGADLFASFTIITFSDPTVTSAGMDILSFSSTTEFRVFDAGGLLTDTFTLVNPANSENFFGVISDVPIGRIELEGVGNNAEIIENFEFGSCGTNTPPTAVCQDITVQLDGSGNVTIVAADVDGGSSDAEGPVTLSIDIDTFDCSNIGPNTVTLTVTDSDGDTDTCTSIVTVEDSVPPVITCPGNITQNVDPGACNAVVNYVVTATDNCNINANNQIPNEDSTFTGLARGYWFTAPTDFVITGLRVPNTASADGQNVQVMRFAAVPASFPSNSSYDALLHWSGLTPGNNFIPVNIPVTAGEIIGILGTRGTNDTNSYTIGSDIVIAGNSVNIERFGTQNGIDAAPAPQGTYWTEIGAAFKSRIEFTYDAAPAPTQTAGLPSGSTFPVGTTTNTFIVTDSSGNASNCSFDVTIVDNEMPVANCAAPFTIQLDAAGNASIAVGDIENGSTDNCGIATTTIDKSTFTCADVGPNTITLTVTDVNGNISTCTTVVTVEDNIAPTAVCAGSTLIFIGSYRVSDGPDWNGNPPVYTPQEAAALIFGGNASDYAISVDPNTTDPSTITNTGWTDSWGDGFAINAENYSLDTGAPGYNDPGGWGSAVSAWVEDHIDYTKINYVWTTPAPIVLQLDVNGQAILDPATIDGGSTDNCGIASISVSPNNFTCADVGPNTVTLTVTDVNGNVSTCTSVVIVEDNVPPVANCAAPFTLQLDAAGNASIAVGDIENGSTDACGIATTTIDKSTFTCADVGPNTVTLTVTDVNGNVSTCTTVVTVEDNVPPTAVCQPFTAQLDATGNVTITPADVDGGSSDACGIASLSVSPSAFTCADVGPNTVTLTVTDVNGNVSTCTTTVTVEDNVPPVANCAAPFTIQLDASGNASIAVGDIENGSTDACGIASTTIDKTDFTCADVGPNTVTLTVTDVNGNVSTCTTIVTVEDSILPTIFCPADITANTDLGECFATVSFATPIAFDNCGIASIVQTMGDPSGSTFPVGVNTIEFTATDVNGNTSTCSFTITVTDNEAPVAVCQNITIQLDAAGNATITAADVDGGSTDQCGVASTTIDINTFDCSDVGDNNVILTVTDVNGNTSTCTAVVTVEDVTAPTVVCQDITVVLDASGTVTIAGIDVDGGSTDACGIDTYTLDIDTFDCSNVGDNTVTLTVTDVNGNSATCTAIVTVEDNTSPVLVCQDFTLELGADGTAILDPSDVIASNDDACGIFTSAVDITDFDCADIGAPITVQVFTIDVNGNLASCTAEVTVVDLLAPEITCPADQTVDPGPGNIFYILPDYFATGEATAIDNCTDPVTITTQSPAAGTPLADGTYTITLTATDAYGNTSTCDFELIVESVLGVGDNNQNLGSIKMYPVPAKNILNISNPQSLELERLEIYDLRGRLVQSEDLRGMGNVKTLNIDQLAAASYYVKIKGASGEITKRLLKE